MKTLSVISVATGAEIDRITLDGDEITYRNGKARSLVEGRKYAQPADPMSNADVVRLMTDWSNGYVQVKAV